MTNRKKNELINQSNKHTDTQTNDKSSALFSPENCISFCQVVNEVDGIQLSLKLDLSEARKLNKTEIVCFTQKKKKERKKEQTKTRRKML